jgi:hypothetical protein
MTPSWNAHGSFSYIGKHRYKVPCALQDGVIARKEISDVFLQPKHIGVSLLVWYVFCGLDMNHLKTKPFHKNTREVSVCERHLFLPKGV